jgi:hypothetical protein
LVNAARVTPAFSPTKSDAPGAEWATYQFSVFGSPPRDGATAAGGMDLEAEPVGAVEPFDKQREGRDGFHPAP